MSKRFVDPALSGPLCLVLLIWHLTAPAFAQSQPQAAIGEKSVLVLHAFESSMPVNEVTDRGLRASLDSGGVSIRNQFFEYLDLARNPGPGHRKLMADLMRLRYGQRKIDMIITLYAEALQFVLAEGRDIFSEVPILTLYMSPGIELPKTNRRMIDHQVSYDMVGTLEIALKLVPGAKRVYVVSGVHYSEKKLQNQARKDFGKWKGQLEFSYLSDMPLEDVLTMVSSAPPETIIFFLSFLADSNGKAYASRDVVRQVSRVSGAPVFGLYDTLLGYGIVGSSITSYEQNGTKAGELALDMLRGARTPENIPAVLNVPPLPMFDWRELRRWNLSGGALPKGSIVINKEFTLWDFRYYIIGGLAFCLAETALIIFLIVQKRQRKMVEEELRQKKEELDQFFNISSDLLCIANTDAYFLHLNPAWERILGYTIEELMAKPFLEFVHPDDLDRTKEAVLTLASQQKIAVFENRYRCRNGTYRWVEWSSAQAGNLIYAAARDTTEPKQAQEALKESEERFRVLVETMNEGLAVQDENGLFTYVNDQLCEMLGYFHGDIIGRPLTEFLDEENQNILREQMQRRRKGKSSPYEITWTRSDGEKITTIVSPKPNFDSQGQFKGSFAVIMDITGRKRGEVEVARARAELLLVERSMRLSELTASLAHELNQPLAAIMSNAQAALRFLKSGKPDLNEFQEIMRDIISDDQRAGNVIQSLRSMMKREEREKRPTILNDILSDVIQIFRSEAIFRNVHIETELDGSLPPVFGDKGQLQQVVLNLIMNAAEAMSRNPIGQRKLILRTQRKDHSLWVSVRDFGPGIDKENLERVFQPFFTTKGTGLGMGLAVCSSIIKGHEGRVWAENNPDGGATFFIELPIYESGK